MENENETEPVMEEGKSDLKQWLQDNLRIIISILIVVAIAAGIYSYSNRTNLQSDDQITKEISDGSTAGDTTDEGESATEKNEVAKPTAPVAVSQETENSFIETAEKGDGMTHLARRALANYLEKNPDSALTAEHKIYIEDYLRKNVPAKRIFVGTSAEFSKDLVKNAIEKSKTLNEKQLKNLQKYTVRVPSLS